MSKVLVLDFATFSIDALTLQNNAAPIANAAAGSGVSPMMARAARREWVSGDRRAP